MALALEYDGADFCGWQRQKTGRSVQACVEQALTRVANEPVRVLCAGRTDAGVHGLGQVIHFETSALRSERSWLLGANSFLPKSVSVRWAKPVGASFHARFSALSRSYRYLLCNRNARPGLWAGKVGFEPRPLAAAKMSQAASFLVGHHDFSTFRAAGCQSAHPFRNITGIAVERRSDIIEIAVTANAFLQHMVRNIVGALIQVGRGDKPPQWLAHVLRLRDRRTAGMAAAPDGLYLESVAYPERYKLPQPPLSVSPLLMR